MISLIEKDFLTKILVDLVQINSTNPSLSTEGVGEDQIARYVADVMNSLGMQVHLHKLKEKQANVVGIIPGIGSGPSLLWNAHMDTVGVAGMQNPFSGEIREGKVFGRGAQDMKGSLAAMLAGVKRIQDCGIHLAGDLIVAGVADEEYASLGTNDLLRHYTADAAIVTEPTNLKLALAHRGFIIYDIETFGRAAHGSLFTEGIDAIIHMGRFLAELDKLEKELRHRPPHFLAGPPSLHASTIQGGDEVSIYPAHCHLQVERRTSPGETVEDVTREFQAILDHLAQIDSTFNARLKHTLDRSPFEIQVNEHIVQVVENVMTEHLGQPPQHSGATFWTDAALLSEAGIPSLVLGPIGGGLHSAVEWVDIQSLVDLADILADTAINFCGTSL